MRSEEVYDRYVLEHPLGEGGAGAVWLARHATLGSAHALKFLHRETPGDRERLLREGRVMATVRHPHVVAVTDCFATRDQVVLVMEFVAGSTLRALLASGVLSPGERRTIGRQIVEGVAEVHRRGLVHRDLKPSNVLVLQTDSGWVARVADFGLVLDTRESGSRLTGANQIMGTLGYMAPEQLLDAGKVDARADVFALGAMLYELEVGRPAYDAPDIRSYRESVLRGVPDLSAVEEPRLAEVLEAALDPQVDRRPRDAGALAAALDGQEGGLPSAQATWGASGGARFGDEDSTLARRPLRGRRQWWAAGALVSVLAVGGLWWAGARWTGPPVAGEVSASAPASASAPPAVQALWARLLASERETRVALVSFRAAGVDPGEAERVKQDLAALLESLPMVRVVAVEDGAAGAPEELARSSQVDQIITGVIGSLGGSTVFNLLRVWPPRQPGEGKASELLDRPEQLFERLPEMLAAVLLAGGSGGDAVALGEPSGGGDGSGPGSTLDPAAPIAPLTRQAGEDGPALLRAGESPRSAGGPRAGREAPPSAAASRASPRAPDPPARPVEGLPAASVSDMPPELGAPPEAAVPVEPAGAAELQLGATIRRYQGQLKYCYESALKVDRSLAGRVAVALDIDDEGFLTNFVVEENTTGSRILADCIEKKVRRWLFPATAGHARTSFVFVEQEGG